MALNSTIPVSIHVISPTAAARRTRSPWPSAPLRRSSGPRRSVQASAGSPSSKAASSSSPNRTPDSGPIRASRRVADGGTIGILSRSDWVACG